MNEFLAEIYNTRESIGAQSDSSDVEKLAEAQILDEALRAEGIDIDTLPGDTILKLAHNLLGDNSALVKAAEEEAKHEEGESPEHEAGEEEEESEEEVKKAALAELNAQGGEETFEEKVAQADFLGRVMAHSYWSEKTNIEKTAGGGALPFWKNTPKESVMNALSKAKDAITSTAKKAPKAVKDYHKAGVGEIGSAFRKHTPGRAAGTLKGRAKSLGKGVAHFAPHATVATGGAAAVAHAAGDKDKKASALDVLAEKRAMEWAQEHGLLQDSEEVKLASAVDQRAIEMLAEYGIDVDAVEAASR
jgi:hypothetical protein